MKSLNILQNSSKINKEDLICMLSQNMQMKPRNSETKKQVNLSLNPFSINKSELNQFIDKLNFVEDFIKIINDKEKFEETMNEQLKQSPSDIFVKKLFNIQLKTKNDDKIIANLQRYDFMFDKSLNPKLIELNQMSASMIGLLSKQMQALNKTNEVGLTKQINQEYFPNLDQLKDLIIKVRDNFMSFYNVNQNQNDQTKKAIMLISENEANINDQGSIIDILEGEIIQLTIEEIFANQNQVDGYLIHKTEKIIIQMVQYRDLQDESQFTEGKYVQRELLETFKVVNVPSIEFLLLNTKYMQYIFQKRYSNNYEDIFSSIKWISDFDSFDSQKDQIKSKNNIVLKPNLEGGQNNLWSAEIIQLIKDIDDNKIEINELAKYSCMELVDSTIWTKDIVTSDSWQNIIDNTDSININENLYDKQVEKLSIISEMGVQGFHLGQKKDGLITTDQEKRIRNVGLVRNKFVDSNECGLFRSGGILDLVISIE